MAIESRFRAVAVSMPDPPKEYLEWLYVANFDPKHPIDIADLKALSRFLQAAGMDTAHWGVIKRSRWHLLVAPQIMIVSLVTPMYETMLRGEPLDAELRQAELDEYVSNTWAGSGVLARLELLNASGESTKYVLEEDTPRGVEHVLLRRLE